MKILLSPQRSNKNIEYSFEKDKITARYNNKIDTFDFSDMPNGRLEADKIKTKLDINPIISAERKEGVLYVELINFIGADATEEERFPSWKEV